MNRIGLMQGRLTPPMDGKIQFFPKDAWAAEFPKALAAGVQSLEWIYDVDGDDHNPIATEEGIIRLLALIRETGIQINSLCANYFMTELLLQGTSEERSGREKKLIWLLSQCQRLGINRIVLPFVDQSRITTKEETQDLITLLRGISTVARNYHLEIHLETDLPPVSFLNLMDKIGQPEVKINYDSGNSASHGYRIAEEFSTYGKYIGSIHIKDRLFQGGTVALGSGAVDFLALRTHLFQINYASDFILESARGIPGDEIAHTRQNVQFVHNWWKRHEF